MYVVQLSKFAKLWQTNVLSKLPSKHRFKGSFFWAVTPCSGQGPPDSLCPRPQHSAAHERAVRSWGCQKQEALTGTQKSNWGISSSPCTISISIIYIYIHTQNSHLREFHIHSFFCSPQKTELLKSLSNYKGLLQLKNKSHHLFQGYLIR